MALALMKLKIFLTKLSWSVFVLAMMLQRSPVVRFIAEVEFSLIPRIQHIWAVVTGAIVVGSYNTVTGASGDLFLEENFSQTTINLGDPLLLRVRVEGSGNTPKTWVLDGDIPDGITWNTIIDGEATISGIPTETGEWPITVRAWRRPNMRGTEATPVSFTIRVETVGPVIKQQPQNQQVDWGHPFELSVAIKQPEGTTYQWQKQNVDNPEVFDDIPDATDATLSFENGFTANNGVYQVAITDGGGTVASDPVTVNVNALFTQQPTNQAADWGGAAELSVAVADTEGVTFQWQKQNVENPEIFDDLPGQTGLALDLANITSNDAGNYQVVAIRGAAMEISAVAALVVNATGFQAWRDMNFEDPFAVEAGEDQNNDSDPFINFVEFLFGGDPSKPDSAASSETFTESIEGVLYAVFQYPPVPSGGESYITPQGSDTPNLANFSALQNGTDGVIIENNAEGYFVKVPANSVLFTRLFISSEL
tara:strand:+ start:1840 stop:3279 length:1440 start_codon:yes stop_codon:yes gene_type:complete